MAKKGPRGDFNMAAEVRKILDANPKLKGKEVIAELKKKFAGRKLNEKSVGVAFSAARKKMGLSRPLKRKRGAKRTVRKMVPSADRVSIDHLRAAAKFVADVGDADKAIAAVRQVQSLQIK